MKINDLMIHDMVLCRQIGYLKVDADLFGTELELEPIPLTPEIILKSGFHSNGVDVFEYTGALYEPLIQISIGRRFLFVIIDYMSHRIETPVHDVHELQHALRICGLHELANNFKI